MSTLRLFPHRLFQIFWDADLEATKLALSFAAVFWGSMLIFKASIFSNTPSAILQILAPQWVWGVAFLLQAMVMLSTLVTRSSTPVHFVFGPLLGCFLWSSAGIALVLSGSLPEGMSAEITSALLSGWILIRWLGDYHHAR